MDSFCAMDSRAENHVSTAQIMRVNDQVEGVRSLLSPSLSSRQINLGGVGPRRVVCETIASMRATRACARRSEGEELCQDHGVRRVILRTCDCPLPATQNLS